MSVSRSWTAFSEQTDEGRAVGQVAFENGYSDVFHRQKALRSESQGLNLELKPRDEITSLTRKFKVLASLGT